eukprot:superscaffoldBa00010775_g24879
MHPKTAESIFILWTFFFITCGPVEGWLQLWEKTPPPKDNTGLTAPEEEVQCPQPPEEKRSTARPRAPEEEVQHLARGITGTRDPGKDTRQTPTHSRPSKEQTRQSYKHHKRDLSIQQEGNTSNISALKLRSHGSFGSNKRPFSFG